MTNIFKPLAAVGVAAAIFAAAPVAAQVNGIATSSPEAVLVSSQARLAAYQQINTTFATQIQQANTLQQEIQQLQISLDTNGDRQLTQEEADANPGVVQQIQAKEQQIETISQPIALAQYYVVEQLINDYTNARNQVVQAKNIQIMLAPEAFQYSVDGVDVTGDILAALNQRLPSVSATPPAGFQPRRETVQTHQAIQEIMIAAAQRAAFQQQQQQQQGNPAAPEGR